MQPTKGYDRQVLSNIESVKAAAQDEQKGKLGRFEFRVLSVSKENKKLKVEYKTIGLFQFILRKLGLGDKTIQEGHIKSVLGDFSIRLRDQKLDQKSLTAETAEKLNAVFARYQVERVLFKDVDKIHNNLSAAYKILEGLKELEKLEEQSNLEWENKYGSEMIDEEEGADFEAVSDSTREEINKLKEKIKENKDIIGSTLEEGDDFPDPLILETTLKEKIEDFEKELSKKLGLPQKVIRDAYAHPKPKEKLSPEETDNVIADFGSED